MCEQCTNDAPGDGLPECPETGHRTEPAVDHSMCGSNHCGVPGCEPEHRRESALVSDDERWVRIKSKSLDELLEMVGEVAALRKVAEAARDVWKVCDEAPSFHAVNEIVIERRLSDLEEALHELDASKSSRGGVK